MRKTFFGDICRVLLESRVGPCFWSGWSWPTGFFKGCPQLEPVLFPYRTGLSTGTRCSISEQRRKKNGRQRERERERRNSCLVGLRPFPLINLFSNQRFHPVRILDFFFFFQLLLFLNYRQFVVSIGKVIDIFSISLYISTSLDKIIKILERAF